MSKDIIIYPSGDTTNSNPFIRFSGGSDMNYIMEITDDGYIDLSVEENIVTSGLTFYVDAGNYDSYSGGTTWYDLIGSSDATLINGPVYDNGSILMDQTDDYIQGSNVSTFQNSAFTIEVVFKLLEDLDNDKFRGFFSTLQGSSSGYQLFWHSSRYFYLFVKNTIAVSTVSNAGNISAGTTISLVARYDNSDSSMASIFVNNTKYSGNSSGSYVAPILPPRFFGRRADSSTNYSLNCNVYTIKYYNRALSDEEITQNFNAIKYRVGL